eukprot:2435592-Prymnesium_polylepis.1
MALEALLRVSRSSWHPARMLDCCPMLQPHTHLVRGIPCTCLFTDCRASHRCLSLLLVLWFDHARDCVHICVRAHVGRGESAADPDRRPSTLDFAVEDFTPRIPSQVCDCHPHIHPAMCPRTPEVPPHTR